VRAESRATVVCCANGVTYRKVCANTMFRDVEEADSMRGLWKDGWDCGYFTPVSLLRMANIVKTK
jgi:hypothetical protein